MRAAAIHILKSEYYTAVYVDGRLVYQDHAISGETMLDVLHLPYTVEEKSDEWWKMHRYSAPATYHA
jgi:hypothetical protein